VVTIDNVHSKKQAISDVILPVLYTKFICGNEGPAFANVCGPRGSTVRRSTTRQGWRQELQLHPSPPPSPTMLERDPKRRRLTPLNAPFRSPLQLPSTPTATTSSTTNPSTSIPTTAAAAISGSKLTTTTPLRPRPPRQFKSPILTRNDEEGLTPEILTLVKRKRALELQIKDERRQLEQADQALKYDKQVPLHPRHR
jgi:hypothetical protein